jgi:hypothetical protein
LLQVKLSVQQAASIEGSPLAGTFSHRRNLNKDKILAVGSSRFQTFLRIAASYVTCFNILQQNKVKNTTQKNYKMLKSSKKGIFASSPRT